MSGVEPEASDAGSALSSAKDAVMSAINKVRGGATDAVSGAEDAVEGAQQGLTSAFESLADSVASKATSAVSDLIQSQVSRLSGLAGDNDIVSSLKSAYSSIQSAEDTSVFGDVELTNMASAVPRAGVADLSLPFESAFEAPLSKFSLDAVPDAFSGISDLATMGASKFASAFTEPLAQSGLSSNNIARAFMGKVDTPTMEIPDSVIPSQEEALSMLSQQVRPLITSDLLPKGAGELAEGVMGRVGGLAESAESAVSGLAESATSAIEGLANSATSALSGAVSTATSAAKSVGSIAEGAAETAGEEVAAGSEGGPGGLIIGGLIAVGTVLYDIFHHHTTTPIAPPPMAPMSVPSFQPGLATGN